MGLPVSAADAAILAFYYKRYNVDPDDVMKRYNAALDDIKNGL